MIGLKHLSTLAIALVASTHAENIAVIKTVAQSENGSASMGSKWCYEGSPSYAIYQVSEHIDPVGSACHFDGEYLASSNEDMGSEMEGSYSNGYWITDTTVYRAADDGIWMMTCVEDESTVYNCPNPSCYTSMERNLKCEGEWVDYFAWFLQTVTGADGAGGQA